MQQTKIELFPNPATDQLNVVVNSNEEKQVELVVTDLAGRVIGVESTNLFEGKNQLLVKVADLSGGIYFIEIKGLDWVEKFVKN